MKRDVIQTKIHFWLLSKGGREWEVKAHSAPFDSIRLATFDFWDSSIGTCVPKGRS